MDKGAKDLIILFIVIIAILAIVLAVNSNLKSDKNRRAFEKEMALRLDVEERVSKLRQENLGLAAELKDKDLKIKKDEIRIELLEKDIADKEGRLAKIKKELDTMTLLKEKLEDNLKEELAKQSQ